MTQQDKEDIAATALRNTVDTLQILKYNVEWFKEMEYHKTISANKNLRPDCAKLINALNAFLFALKAKSGDSVGGVLRIMKRDQLHDISLLLQETYCIDNLPDLIAGIKQMKIDSAIELANNGSVSV